VAAPKSARVLATGILATGILATGILATGILATGVLAANRKVPGHHEDDTYEHEHGRGRVAAGITDRRCGQFHVR
jgi:hypothetical protein